MRDTRSTSDHPDLTLCHRHRRSPRGPRRRPDPGAGPGCRRSWWPRPEGVPSQNAEIGVAR